MSGNGLLDRLIRIQDAHGWSSRQMGRRLGITHTYWIMLCQGKRQPGRKFFVGVFKAFPELEGEAIAELRTM